MHKSSHSISAEFKPSKSGVFTLGSLLIAACLVVFGAWFLSENKMLSGLLLFVCGVAAGITSYVHGFRSSKDQDMESGHPFQIVASENSYQLSADPRTKEEVLLSLISATAQTLNDRKPLPEAKGMVSKEGVGDASRKDEANKIVEAINLESSQDFRGLEESLTVHQTIDPKIVENAPKNDLPLESSNVS